MVPLRRSPRLPRERANQQPAGRCDMNQETVVRSSTSGGSPRRPTGGIARLHSLGTTASAPVRVDPRKQEGWELVSLLHEAGAVTVERRYAGGEVIFEEGDPDNALYVLT